MTSGRRRSEGRRLSLAGPQLPRARRLLPAVTRLWDGVWGFLPRHGVSKAGVTLAVLLALGVSHVCVPSAGTSGTCPCAPWGSAPGTAGTLLRGLPGETCAGPAPGAWLTPGRGGASARCSLFAGLSHARAALPGEESKKLPYERK